MTDNRSSYWSQPGPGRLDRNAELFAVLDGADVSERVRAAVNHALNGRRGNPDHVNALVNRYLSERDGGRGRPPAPASAYDRRRRYTLHLTFSALDLSEARDSAVMYAEGLAVLRPELGVNPPLLSRAESWNHVEPLFCGAVGPDEEICADLPGHPGFHRAAGLGGLCWGDGDPRPDRP